MKANEKKILVIHGPNLNMLGKREPEIYGTLTLEQLNAVIAAKAGELGVFVECIQTNHEGVMVDTIQAAAGRFDCIIINPAAFTHYSVAVRDALASIDVPAVEVHLSNIYRREEFRQHSVTAPITIGQIAGFGVQGYVLALYAAVDLIERGGRN